MEIIRNPLFWGEVGLAAASKLALLAAVLWVARLAIAARVPEASGRSSPLARAAGTDAPRLHVERPVAAAVSGPRAPVGYINLRRPPEPGEPAAVPTDQLRRRLLEFVEQRAAGRVRS